MSLATRIRRMEETVSERPPPCCGSWRALILFDSDPETVKAEPCPICGRERYRMEDGAIIHPWKIVRFVFPKLPDGVSLDGVSLMEVANDADSPIEPD